MTLKGDAGFKYTPPGRGEVTHALQFPLTLQMTPGHRKRRYAMDSLNYNEREVVTIGTGRAEIEATLRFDSDPQGLIDMLEQGADGVVLTYYPSLADTGTSYDFRLIGEDQKVRVDPDSDRYGFGEYQKRILLRDASPRGVSLEALFAAA